MDRPIHKRPLHQFLARNPMPHPWTTGAFYREKMRAIHRIAPDRPFSTLLELGGGQSGLTALLYPRARVINLEIDLRYARSPCNLRRRAAFVNGSAEQLPFRDQSQDAVTFLDVLEHVPEDEKAISEALRVLRPGGDLLLSAPNERWRFPFYPGIRRICPSETDILKTWGHVRRGYSLTQLQSIIQRPCLAFESYINPLTVIAHDVGFSHLPAAWRQFFSVLLTPMTTLGYALPFMSGWGVETVSLWKNIKP